MKAKTTNKKLIKSIALILAVIFVLCNFAFLCSIHFRIDYFFLSTVLGVKGYNYPKYNDFDEHKENFEILIGEIKSFVEERPDFYNEYEADKIVARDLEGIHFIKTESKYPNIVYDVHKPKSENWKEVRSCLYSFPERGFDVISLKEEYPEYVFFPCNEYSPRIIVYTGGERPYKYINELWDRYEYVGVVKLARGWYDIQPQGKK